MRWAKLRKISQAYRRPPQSEGNTGEHVATTLVKANVHAESLATGVIGLGSMLTGRTGSWIAPRA
jgi:hypothetical protein